MQITTSIAVNLTGDIIALIITFILLYAVLFENAERDNKTLYFALCCIFTILSLLCDIPAWLLENKPGYDSLLYVLNTAALIFSAGPVIAVAFYEIEIIGRKNVSTIHPMIITAVCLVAAALSLMGVVTGYTFRVSNGVFRYGPWYPILAVVSLCALVYMDILAIVKREHLGMHNVIAFIAHMLMPFTAAVIEVFWPEINFALLATSIGLLLVYVMLESNHVSALNVRGELLKELSYKDMLTGLGNRRAYDKVLDSLENDRAVNIIFCDVNGLKYINDKDGHTMGDTVLKHFADVLRRQFSCDSIYRISGDEFVIIIPDLNAQSFDRRVQYLKDYMRAENDLAAVGAASGFGRDKKKLLSLSEERMYEHKKQSLLRHPEYVRK